MIFVLDSIEVSCNGLLADVASKGVFMGLDVFKSLSLFL